MDTTRQIYELPFGVVLVKNFLNDDDQESLMKDILKVYERNGMPYNADEYSPNALFSYNAGRYGRTMYEIKDNIMNKECLASIKNIMKVGENIADIANNVKENDKYVNSLYKFVIPNVPLTEDKVCEGIKMNGNSVYCVSYNTGGQCYRHADYWNSWVFGVTLGHSCDFRYGIHAEETREYKRIKLEKVKRYKKAYKNKDIIVKVDSGDVVIFNGNLLYHAVTHIYDELPEYWSGLNTHGYINRVCLQYRDDRTIDNDATNTRDAVLLGEQMRNNYNKIARGK